MKKIFTSAWFLSFLIFLLAVGAFFLSLKYLSSPSRVNVFYNDPFEKKTVAQVNDFKADNSSDLSIAFFGDLMLDRSVRQHIEKKGIDSIFAKDEALYKEADLNIANLEGPVANFNSKSVNTKENEIGHFSFVFDPANLPALKKRKFEVLNIGNNHILNFGNDGLRQTQENLTSNKIEFFGSPKDNNYIIYEKNGARVALLSYNQFQEGSLEKVTQQLEEVRSRSDIIIVYTHWGEEYQTSPNNRQQKLAHQFIDAGADAVFGSHPHVVQSVEEYNGKYIFYSLGNFVFDQFFSPETMKGLTVLMKIDSKKWTLSYEMTSLGINKSFQVSAIKGERQLLP